MRCLPRWYTNLHVQVLTPVMSVKAPDILAPDFASTNFRIVIPTSAIIYSVLSCAKIYILEIAFPFWTRLTLLSNIRLRKALHIEWERSALNKQLQRVNLTLTF